MLFSLALASLLGLAAAPAPDATPTPTVQSNSEMTSIFDADQAARSAPQIDWAVVGPADGKRRARTEALLNAGQLHSADDFYHAAFVFQHGDKPEDFLKAHALALVAAAEGKPEAVWIAAASLDRYLQNIGQPQIYGTQYRRMGDSPWTQDPYRPDLLPDAVRRASHVETLAEQAEKLQEMQAKQH